MAENDVFQLKDIQSYLGKEIINVYTYHQTDGTGGAEELALEWINTILPFVVAVQNVALVHTAVEVLNYQDEEDFHVETLGSGYEGEVSGDALPRFNSWGYKVNRATRAVRNGSKRVAGVTESWQTNGVAATGTPLATLEALAEALAPDPLVSGEDLWVLVIPSLSGEAIAPVPYAVSSVTYVRMTTQNSRKD